MKDCTFFIPKIFLNLKKVGRLADFFDAFVIIFTFTSHTVSQNVTNAPFTNRCQHDILLVNDWFVEK